MILWGEAEASGMNYWCLLPTPGEGLAQLTHAIFTVAKGCSSLCCCNVPPQCLELCAGMFLSCLGAGKTDCRTSVLLNGSEDWPGSCAAICGGLLW